VRVPLLNASLTDCVFEMARETTVEEVNALFAAYAAGTLKGILGYEDRPLVSRTTPTTRGPPSSTRCRPWSSPARRPRSTPGTTTNMGYAWRLVDVALMVGALDGGLRR
jgi:glyceraldehyde 3-phosphate dehydrogenase